MNNMMTSQELFNEFIQENGIYYLKALHVYLAEWEGGLPSLGKPHHSVQLYIHYQSSTFSQLYRGVGSRGAPGAGAPPPPPTHTHFLGCLCIKVF